MNYTLVCTQNNHRFIQKIKVPFIKAHKENFISEECNLFLTKDCQHKTLLLPHFLFPNIEKNIIELLFLIDLLCQKSNTLTLFIPYLPYARNNSTPLHANTFTVMQNILLNSKAYKVLTCEVHNPNSILNPQKIINLSSSPLFKKELFHTPNKIVIAPDEGAQKRAQELSIAINCPFIQLTKKRNKQGCIINGKIENPEMTYIIYDDLCDSGQTLKTTISFLKEKGVKKIQICITHLLAKTKIVLELLSVVDKLYITNSIRCQTKHPKLKVLEIENLLFGYIKNK